MRIYLIKLGLIGFNKKNCERVILTELQEKYIRNEGDSWILFGFVYVFISLKI